MLRVPRAAMHLDFLGRRVTTEILTDMNGREAQRAGAVPVENGFVEETPEARLDLRGAKPTAVLTVRPGRHQSGKIAVLGALIDFVLKPARVEARKLRIGEFAVARYNDNFRTTITRQVGTIASLL